MTKKADPNDLAGRIQDLCADPSNDLVPRVANAGRIIDGYLITHNGLRIKPADPGYVKLLQGNRGCHEPQEEYIFQEVMKHIPPKGRILELGAYWAFYSMWFANSVPDADCYLVEPRRKNLKLGQHNFEHNGMRGNFFQGKIGDGRLTVDAFLSEQQLSYVDVLHADIQGAEYEMLHGAAESLGAGRFGYVFVGTHSQQLHYRCKAYLESHGYFTVAHADFDHGTYCCDGVLVARRKSLDGLETLDIPLRDANAQASAERTMRAIGLDPPVMSTERPWRRIWSRIRRNRSAARPYADAA